MICKQYRPQLPCAPFPEGGEGILGYRLRLTELNHYPRATWIYDGPLVRTVSYGLENRQTGDAIEQLARLTGFPPDALAQTLLFPRLVPLRFLTISEPRVCPECLREGAYLRRSWDLCLLVICPVHKTWMLSACPHCGRNIGWARPTVRACVCGFDLSAAATPLAGNLAVSLCRRLALAAEDSQISGQLAQQRLNFGECFPHLDMSLSEMCLLIMFIGGLGIHGLHGKPFMKPNLIKMQYAVQLVQQAANMLQDWPSTFNKSLQQLTAARHKKGRLGLTAQFGYMYTYMYRYLFSSEFDFLREQFELYIRDNFAGLLTSKALRYVSQQTQQAGRYVSSMFACERLHIAWEQLIKLIKRGDLPGLVQYDKSGRSRVIVERVAIERFLVKREDSVSLAGSKALLGLNSRWRLRELQKEGLLSAGETAANTMIKCPLSKAAITTLLSNLTRDLPVLSTPLPRGQKQLQRLLRYPLCIRKVFPDFIKSVLDKRTVPTGKLATIGGINGIVFKESEVVSFVKQRQGFADWSNVSECAASLHVSSGTVYLLMQCNLLKHRFIKIGNSHQLFVSPDELRRFRSRYVMTPELAKLLKIPRINVDRRLLKHGIKPVQIPKDNRVGINVYPRRSVKKLDWISKTTT